VRNEVPALWYE
jgi:hypothetical protein